MLYVTCLSLLTLLMRAISGAYVEKRQHGPEERQFQNYGDVVISTAAQTDVGIPYGEAYNSVPGGGPIMISDDPGAAPSTVQNPSVITPPPGSPIHQACTGNALSVSIFYWPQVSSNTDCLATIAMPTESSPKPLGISPEPPSVYAVIESFTITATDGRVWATDFFTASFDPEEMSTKDGDGTTKSFNFGDFPCPPPSVELNGQPYQPFWAPPPSLLDQMGKGDPDFLRDITGEPCVLGDWIDPPHPVHSVLSVNPAVLPPPEKRPQQRRAQALPLETAHAPVKTPQP